MHIISRDAFDFKGQMQNLTRVQNIAICGLFIALYIILSNFNIRISSVLEIRFGFLVLAVAGMFGGPMMGIIVGAGADIISTILTGQAFFFGFTFSYALLGCLFGVILYHSRPSVPRCIACSLVDALVSLFINTLWLSIMYGNPYQALMITRLPKTGVMFFVDVVFLVVVLGAFSRVFQTLHLSVQND